MNAAISCRGGRRGHAGDGLPPLGTAAGGGTRPIAAVLGRDRRAMGIGAVRAFGRDRPARLLARRRRLAAAMGGNVFEVWHGRTGDVLLQLPHTAGAWSVGWTRATI